MSAGQGKTLLQLVEELYEYEKSQIIGELQVYYGVPRQTFMERIHTILTRTIPYQNALISYFRSIQEVQSYILSNVAEGGTEDIQSLLNGLYRELPEYTAYIGDHLRTVYTTNYKELAEALYPLSYMPVGELEECIPHHSKAGILVTATAIHSLRGSKVLTSIEDEMVPHMAEELFTLPERIRIYGGRVSPPHYTINLGEIPEGTYRAYFIYMSMLVDVYQTQGENFPKEKLYGLDEFITYVKTLSDN